jgi:hypothetical protein
VSTRAQDSAVRRLALGGAARARGAWALVLAGGLSTLAACGGSPVELEVIEEVSFAPSLGIDLAAFTRLPSGVYIRDHVVGSGRVIAAGDVATVQYTGWLRTGAQFDSGVYVYDYGVTNARTPIAGWVLGMEGMAVGGTRTLIIPPEHAYGARAVGPIPAGSVLVFRVTLQSVA